MDTYVATVSETISALTDLVEAVSKEFDEDSEMLHYSRAGRQRLFELLRDASEKLGPHIHRGGGKDADECGLCGRDLRHSIHLRKQP